MTDSVSRIVSRVVPFGLLAAAVVAVSGCSNGSGKKVTIDGTITYKGERLKSGILRIVGSDGSFATAPIRPDGTFTLTDLVPGEVKVGVMEAPHGAGSSDAKPGAAAGPAKRAMTLPARVRDPEKSGLKYTISSETRDLTIDIN